MSDDASDQLASMLRRVDPQLRHMAQHRPAPVSSDPMIARRQFTRALKISRALRDAAYTTDRVDVADSSFRVPAGDREIDIRSYRPLGVREPLPVLVYCHGALLAGDLDTEHDRCLRYAAEAGCAVVSVAYRRPPEHPFPAPTDDCYAAVQWIHETGAEWGVDPRRIAVAGSSSGAMLAAAVALLVRDRGGPPLALQMLLYPALDNLYRTRSVAAFSMTGSGRPIDSRWIWRYYTGDDPMVTSSPYAVPARCREFSGLASAYILVAEIDPLRDEALDYAVGMMRAGVRVELHLVARTCHGFDAANPEAAVSQRSLDEQCAALRWAFANVVPG